MSGFRSGADVRRHLVAALNADLVGPHEPDTATSRSDEILDIAPSRFYLCGFLAPEEDREVKREDSDVDDEKVGSDDDSDDSHETASDPAPRQRSLFPVSMGLSVYLPKGHADAYANDELVATVSYADYVPVEVEDGRRKCRWQRVPVVPAPITIKLDPRMLKTGIPVPNSNGLVIEGQIGQDSARMQARVLSLFVVNRREPGKRGREDAQFAFQVELSLRYKAGFLPKPEYAVDKAAADVADPENRKDLDERQSKLQFRNHHEYGVGHGVSLSTLKSAKGNTNGQTVTTISTSWLPETTVMSVTTHEVPGVVTEMDALANLGDAAAARAALEPICTAYEEWLAAQAEVKLADKDQAATATRLLRKADGARKRILAGIKCLEQDRDALAAFRLANRAMADAARARSKGGKALSPRWRLFQLAFLLQSLPGIVNESADERERVDLIFFPTGGGKTEAYLGVVAFTLLLRRMRGNARPDGGLGVAVILRYTLRLLTLDQLGRAAALICSLELLRRAEPKRLGTVRFSLGLWIGKSGTANTLAEFSEQLGRFSQRGGTSGNNDSPCPIATCPWCGTELNDASFELTPNRTKPTSLSVGCADIRCAFSNAHGGLPLLFVDEQVYRELPSFLIGTVDKFAMLPWLGRSGALFGRVSLRKDNTFFGPMDGQPKDATSAVALPEGLRPPDIIIQDELHLIAGPLGTMVGLYETAIEALCRRGEILPKIIASTATVRRAREQVLALYGRTELDIFPPPGIDENESFFAKVNHTAEGRLYVGVAAPGRSLKATLIRTYVALLGAAEKVRSSAKDEHEQTIVDGYLTLVGYFNSLRELGGMRRLVEDEVRSRVALIEERRPGGLGGNRWFANRIPLSDVLELTSRQSTAQISQAKHRLEKPYTDEDHTDVLLASNMISVGVDISRLGLMVVAGQPKTTSEYIQASSRVGRDARWPGLVVTVLNVHKPRDRSHYERFAAYHQSFYRRVEPTSVTPFCGPALDRGLAAVLVAYGRLGNPALTPPEALAKVIEHRHHLDAMVSYLAARAERQGHHGDATAAGELAKNLASRAAHLIDDWVRVARSVHAGEGAYRYSKFDKSSSGTELLHMAPHNQEDEPENTPQASFRLPTSMRDVEATAHLWVVTGTNLEKSQMAQNLDATAEPIAIEEQAHGRR